MRKSPRITRYKPIQKRSTPSGSILPWIVLAAFLALCIAGWQRHLGDIMADTDPAQQRSFTRLLDASQTGKKVSAHYATKQAAALAEVYFLSQEEVAKPVKLW